MTYRSTPIQWRLLARFSDKTTQGRSESRGHATSPRQNLWGHYCFTLHTYGDTGGICVKIKQAWQTLDSLPRTQCHTFVHTLGKDVRQSSNGLSKYFPALTAHRGALWPPVIVYINGTVDRIPGWAVLECPCLSDLAPHSDRATDLVRNLVCC